MMPIATRVGTFAQRSSLVQQMMTTQKRLYDTQTQLSTEQKSQTYAGVSVDSFRLLRIETEMSSLQRYTASNEVARVRLQTMTTAVDSTRESIREFRNNLTLLANREFVNVTGGDPVPADQKKALDEIQERAYAVMEDMAYYLNADSDGRFLFAGGRTNVPPMDLPYGSLDDFQADYTGDTTSGLTFPDTRGANVSDIKVTNDEHGTLGYDDVGPFTNLDAVYSVTATNAGSFSGIPVGTTIEISDGSGNSDRYTVLDNTDTVMELGEGVDGFNVTGFDADATVKTVSYYQGDGLEIEHRIDDQRSIDLGVTAKDPAFETAWRALGTLAQGNLAANTERITTALNWLNEALESSDVAGSDLDGVARRLGYQEVTLERAINDAEDYQTFLANRQSDIEGINIVDAATRLQDDARALEISFQSYARISQLSLQNYI